MTDLPLLRDLGLTIFTATLFVLIGRRLGLPSILMYLVGGLLLGPASGLLQVTPSIQLIAEVGIALLLFLVGMELSVEKVRSVGRVAVFGGLAQVAVTFVLGWGAALLLGYDGAAAAVLGLAVSFSSTVVVVKLIGARGDLTVTYGRIAVGILLIQDVVVAVVLTLLSGLADPGEARGAAVVASGLGRSFAGVAGLTLAAALGSRYLLPRLLGWLSGWAEAVFVVTLAWCFLFIVGAELVHISVELGAFLAGVAIGQLPQNLELRQRVRPLADFFLAVFFVSLGVRLEPAASATLWPSVVVFTLLATVLKPVLVYALVRAFGYRLRTSVLAATTLGQTSEFSFILAGLAAASGLIGADVLSLVGVIGILTIGISAMVIPRADRLYSRFRAGARGDAPGRHAEPVTMHRTGHVIVVGMNTLGRLLVRALAKRGEDVLAIDTDSKKLVDLPAETMTGSVDYAAVLERADYRRAKLVVSALQIEDTNSLLAFRCRRHGVPVSIHAFDPSLVDELRAIGVDHLMISKHDGIRQVAAALRAAGVIA